ncbi:unnamed protein product [Acidithrix sp. C25]|nr:unnamed protein product [Acidithrix sp. C25]
MVAGAMVVLVFADALVVFVDDVELPQAAAIRPKVASEEAAVIERRLMFLNIFTF